MALIEIDKVKIGDRIRKDMGNLEELAGDIKENGLINPPVVTPEYELIAGERRLQAMKLLGYKQIEVRILKPEDAEHMLMLEISENEERKDFTRIERLDWARQLERLERQKAKERQGERTDLNIVENLPQSEEGKTRDIVAQKTGIGSGKQYEKEKYVADNADPETLEQWNNEEISTHNAYNKVKELESKLENTDKLLEEQIEINQNLTMELNKEKQKEPETQIIEKEIIKEILPDDYEDMKGQLERLRKSNQELENNLVIERNKKALALSQLEEEQQKDKLIKEINSFGWSINGFIKNVGGLIYLTDYLDQVPPTSKKLFIDSAKRLSDWASQLVYNLNKED